MFLHRLFGYRGVVLFPWHAKFFDRDSDKIIPHGEKFPSTSTKPNKFTQKDGESKKELKGKTATYYQVLIDQRDWSHTASRAQTESVTFLNPENTRNLYALPGLDYVAHDDIIPYSTQDKSPIQHELFERFLASKEEMSESDNIVFAPQSTLLAWQEKNHTFLEMSEVHKETTEDIRVTVIPFYMGFKDQQNTNVYWWRYCIRLENLGDRTVQLRERNWRIFSLSGTLETVRGRGVVGVEPILSPGQAAFQYSSHVSLQAPSGHMWGTFRMERDDGYSFDCRIPPFSLESKGDDPSHPDIVGN
eukprot:06814.XXX_103432_104588_1 [CDS] Oithona nana genome sequencing.